MQRNIEKISAIIREKDQIIVVENNGVSKFPEVNLNQGQSPRYTLIRYLQDKLNIMVETGHVLDIIDYDKDDEHVNNCFFICKIIGGSIKSGKNHISWVKKEDLKEHNWPQELQSVVQELSEKL